MLRSQIQHILVLLVISFSILVIRGAREEECGCVCYGDSVCELLSDLRLEIDVNTVQHRKWAPLLPFVQNLRNRWREEIVSIVETEMKKYISNNNFVAKPENMIRISEEDMMNDSDVVPKPSEGEIELAKDVSNLLTKVEKVENRTMEVEEELKSERRVRRHLQQEVKETQTTLISIEDQLQNVSVPVDAILSQVQMVVFHSLEEMNKTIYEDHLQKLYYKVDGVAYQNETRKLDERLDQVEIELQDNSNDTIVAKLAANVKNLNENMAVLNNSIGDDLAPRLMVLETETVRKDTAEGLEEKMSDILNTTYMFRTGLVDLRSDIQDFRSFQQNLQNFTEEWTQSLHSLQTDIEMLKNSSANSKSIANYVTEEHGSGTETENFVLIDETVNVLTQTETNEIEIGEESETPSDEVTVDDGTPNVAEKIRIGEVSDFDNTTCDVPVTDDPHLMLDAEEGSNGRQGLIFGCRPIGRYAVSKAPIPARCLEGPWKGPFPSCLQLPDEITIELFAQKLKNEHPCPNGPGEYPDPSDCSRFFNCSHGKITIIHCPGDLHFNAQLKVCDYPKVSGCVQVQSEIIKELKEMIPPILIEPNSLDKPNGLLGTGPAAKLIVHPRSSFTLHCLYPENFWGYPVWNVISFLSQNTSKNVIPQEGKNRISMKVTAATEEDSGLYRCRTPFGKEHVIRVEIKAVHCPSIPLDEEYEDVYYRPTPEGEHRILGTTVLFPCEDGVRIHAVCRADGSWSRGVPDPNECTLKKRKTEDWWDCSTLDTTKHPDLILQKIHNQKIVMFKCAGRKRLIGNSFTRCRDDGQWSHTSLPKCID